MSNDKNGRNILEKTRAYLSGPMDFVGSRVIEKYLGWRSILTPILQALKIRVLDPWNKPRIRGHRDYGLEGILPEKSKYAADFWNNAETRARYEKDFWETVHIDLRMTDLADFLVAFCPTNIYSVGTVHEIVVAREQHKPVLLVSPPISHSLFPEIDALPKEVKRRLQFYGLKENPSGLPSQWHGNIVGGQNLFDGFGWENLEFKSSNFYNELLDNILNICKPATSDKKAFELWLRVKNWILDSGLRENLRGGIYEHIEYTNDEEKQMFSSALKAKEESKRKYFWYNKAYTPKRPLLYHFFLIASGFIPPKIKFSPYIDDDGNISTRSFQSSDDNWLLISPEV